MGIKTILSAGTSLFKDKGSKHYGFAFNVNSEKEAKDLIEKLRKENSKANHVCFGYVIQAEPHLIERSSDDGEPSNSAGPPILQQLQKENLVNGLVAVVRYFGGTKLGVGGLINAYRSAAEQALADAKIGIVERKVRAVVKVPFSQVAQLSAVLNQQKASITQDVSTQQHYAVIIEVPEVDVEAIKKSLPSIHGIWSEK